MKDGYYKDGLTKLTDPFYAFKCKQGHRMWCITFTEECPECGAKAEFCVPANKYKKEAVSCN